MKYYSTNNKQTYVNFREAVLSGQPNDKGLFFPENIAKLNKDFFSSLKAMTNAEIAFEVIKPFIGEDIPEKTLKLICEETVNFAFPVVRLNDRVSVLELFHGPTYAFKDVGAGFMSRCLRYFAEEIDRKIVVITATSGDTGGAVANGFLNVEGIEVVILYPKGKVSHIQEQQMTTLGGNITTLEVKGDFDDCQAMAKQALADEQINKHVFLTSANSINIARWLPQQFYYFIAAKEFGGSLPLTSVPSGNFGNIASGILAAKRGLPIKGLIAACNANDVVPRFLQSGKYEPRETIATISNAMDVSRPSNFVRIQEMLGERSEDILKTFTAVSITEQETRDAVKKLHTEFNYTADPHGAVAFVALERSLKDKNETGLFLETAHPIKFDSVETILGKKIEPPIHANLSGQKEKQAMEIEVDHSKLKEILLQI